MSTLVRYEVRKERWSRYAAYAIDQSGHAVKVVNDGSKPCVEKELHTKYVSVSDIKSAQSFLRWCCSSIGLGFHPETDFADYIDDDGKPVFTRSQARILNTSLEECYKILPDVCVFCMECQPFSQAGSDYR